jgi:hypothetical protein
MRIVSLREGGNPRSIYINVDRMKLNGKYTFQNGENLKISHSELDTKDAFWHSKAVIAENSTLR